MKKLGVVCALTVAVLAACGGGGGGGTTTAAATTGTGVFLDSATQGLRYVSGSQSGTTGANGSFTYEVGKPVTFSIGGVTLGTVSAGSDVVTPVDLVASSTTATPAVQNIVRLLTMLDTDGDPTNGITISPAIATAASAWTQPDFAVAEGDFTTAIGAIKTSAGTADGGAKTLLTAAQAQTHVESSLRCARSGAFKGTYSPSTGGTFGMLVSATTGAVVGVGGDSNGPFTFTAGTAGALDGTGTFTAGVTSTGSTFTGSYKSANAISGTWASTVPAPANGTFSGSRIGGAMTAKYRFTGFFVGSSSGLFTFDVDGSNNVTGVSYDRAADQTSTLTGTVNSGALSVTTSTGATATATINLSTGALTGGTWADAPSSTSGTFTGGGCKLN